MQRRHVLALPGALLATPAIAQPAWPQRPVRVVVPFPPGGATDTMARTAAMKLQERLGQPFVVENRPGGNGVIGGQFVAAAAPDGYTLCSSASIQMLARLVMRSPGYDPVADLLPIVRTGRGPLLLLMSQARSPSTLPELVQAIRRNPAEWSFAISSLGAAGHLATLDFIRELGVEMVQVPYRGTAPAITDVVAGNVQLVFEPILATWPPARDGRAKALAVTSSTRSPSAPSVPTTAEGGMPGLNIESWWALWGPRGLPQAITARIGEVLSTAMFEPDVHARVGTLGLEPLAQSGQELEQFMRADFSRAEQLLRQANFQPE